MERNVAHGCELPCDEFDVSGHRFPCIRERQVLTTGGKRFAELANLTGFKAALSAALKVRLTVQKETLKRLVRDELRTAMHVKALS
jgi:hypothetical protein